MGRQLSSSLISPNQIDHVPPDDYQTLSILIFISSRPGLGERSSLNQPGLGVSDFEVDGADHKPEAINNIGLKKNR